MILFAPILIEILIRHVQKQTWSFLSSDLDTKNKEVFMFPIFPFSIPGSFPCSVLPSGTADTTASGNKAQTKITLKVPNLKGS